MLRHSTSYRTAPPVTCCWDRRDLSSSALLAHKDLLLSIGSDGDILLYGCDVAGGAQGQAFLKQLAALTGADLAASDLTGAAAFNGDADLEIHIGDVSANSVLSQSAMNDIGFQCHRYLRWRSRD